MKRLVLNTVIIIMLITMLTSQKSHAFDNKYYIGQPFKYFDIEDIYNQRWISTYLRGKPVVILMAHRNQKYEVAKWAEAFRQEYGIPGSIHLLWVVNMHRMPWTVSKREVINQWREFNALVPVLMDWDGTIGRGLRVNYQVPNIIVLDAFGRLAMHEMHTFNFEVYSAISARVKILCSAVPNYVASPMLLSSSKGAYSY